MPELAEVEYFRTRWNAGLNQRVMHVQLHATKRLFRSSDPHSIARTLRGATLRSSETRGKQILFRFSKNAWLGVHLGMTGKLRVEPPSFAPGKHDHFVLVQKRQSLVFSDPRMFGRVRFHHGEDAPTWWSTLSPAVTARQFTMTRLREILRRRGRTPLKSLLLMQHFFPGIGNWMADEILWQARLDPRLAGGALPEAQQRVFWRTIRAVSRAALKTIGIDWGDPPDHWLFHQRWKKSGVCPRHGSALKHATIGGRTTVWCPRCQFGSAASGKESGEWVR